jgi:hypothetical protein
MKERTVSGIRKGQPVLVQESYANKIYNPNA